MSRPVSNVIDAGERGWRRLAPQLTSTAPCAPPGVIASGARDRASGCRSPWSVGLAALGVATYFKPMQVFDKLPSVSGKLAVQGSKITMELPRIAGFTRDKRSYELNAETAVQDITSPDIVELQNLRARLEMQDKDVVNVTANSGTYSTKADKVVLARPGRGHLAARLQGGAARGGDRNEEGQCRLRSPGRHHVAERLAQVEPHGDRRFRRSGSLRSRRRLSTSRPTREAPRNERTPVASAPRSPASRSCLAPRSRSPPSPRRRISPAARCRALQFNRDQPVKIESDALEVRDKSQQATFIGKVKLTQGDTILQCQNAGDLLRGWVRCIGAEEGRARRRKRAAEGPAAATADQARRSQGRCAGDAEGPDRQRRSRHL